MSDRWQDSAKCKGLTELFFHPEGERGDARKARTKAAVEICKSCQVKREYKKEALTNRERYGVWAGISEATLQGMHT